MRNKSASHWFGIAVIAIPPLTLVAVPIAVAAAATFVARPDYPFTQALFTLSLVLYPLALLTCGATTVFSIAMWGYGGEVKLYRIGTAVGLISSLLLILTAAIFLSILSNAILSMG